LKNRSFLDKITYYFKDSYGMDKFSKYLLIAGLILYFIDYTAIIGFAIMGYAVWRSLSKNKTKRYQELAAFEKHLSKVIQMFYKQKSSINQFKEYKVFTCPNCSQKLRIPRNRGKVTITCKKCSTSFKGKS
jgi:hypothetical protein